MDDPSDRRDGAASETSVGGFDRGGRAFILVLFVAGGLALGFLLPLLARWASDLPWVPLRGPLELISSFEAGWLVWGRPVLGAAAAPGSPSPSSATPRSSTSRTTRFASRRQDRSSASSRETKVDGVHRVGSNTVIENSRGRVLFQGDVEGGTDALRAAFLRHGYPWEGPPQRLG